MLEFNSLHVRLKSSKNKVRKKLFLKVYFTFDSLCRLKIVIKGKVLPAVLTEAEVWCSACGAGASTGG